MNERIRELAEEADAFADAMDVGGKNYIGLRDEYFAELIVRECIQVAAKQRNPSNLNYKPSERFVEDLKLHFGVEE